MNFCSRRLLGYIVTTTSIFLTLIPEVLSAQGFSVSSFSPTGVAKNIKQIQISFSEDVVARGSLASSADPGVLMCSEAGKGRWLSPNQWVFDFTRVLPSGTVCRFEISDQLKSVSGAAISGTRRYEFSTGGPSLVSVSPYSLTTDASILLTFDVPVKTDSVLQHGYFSVVGVNSRIELDLMPAKVTDQILKNEFKHITPEEQKSLRERSLALRARQNLPEGSKVLLVLDRGLESQSGIKTQTALSKQLEVQPPFKIKVTCERSNENSGCLPFNSVRLEMSAAIRKDDALKFRISGTHLGKSYELKPTMSDSSDDVYGVSFRGPFPARSELLISIPTNLKDIDQRPLTNQKSFPLKIKTDDMPPLAKFAAPLGFYESTTDPAVAITVRDVESNIKMRSYSLTNPETEGTWKKILRNSKSVLGLSTVYDYQQIMDWLDLVRNADRAKSVFSGAAFESKVVTSDLPRKDQGTFEVLGIPLKSTGIYVMEAESQLLGKTLLGKDAPMFVPTVAVNTDLAVTFKSGADQSLAWVTRLSSSKAVSSANIKVFNCKGEEVGSAKTNEDGVAILKLKSKDTDTYCDQRKSFFSGFFIFAEKAGDVSFTHTSFNQGIESGRFDVDYLWSGTFESGRIRKHTLFDRSLYRQGETAYMRHFFRERTKDGIQVFNPKFSKLEIKHVFHEDKAYEVTAKTYGDGSASSQWDIPKDAPLGGYLVNLTMNEGGKKHTYELGRLEVSEFKLPVMKATAKLESFYELSGRKLRLSGGLQFLSGASASDYPVHVQLSATQMKTMYFKGYEGVAFSNKPVKLGIKEPYTEPASATILAKDFSTDKAGMFSESAVVSQTGAFQIVGSVQYRDPNGDIQQIYSQLDLAASKVNIGIELIDEQYSFKKARVYALDPFGKPLKGVSAGVDLFKDTYFSHRKKIIGGFYSYESHNEISSIGPYCKGVTNAEGYFDCSEPLADSMRGEIIFQAKYAGPEGASYASQSRYIYSQEATSPQKDHDRMDLILSKNSVEPGETIRVQAVMPFLESKALVTIEREGVSDYYIESLTREKPYFDLKIKREWVPNVVVSVFAIRGRISEPAPTAMVDLGRPAMKLGLAKIKVGLQKHTLDVKLTTPKEIYAPKDRVTATLTVKFPEGQKPMKSFASIAVVDEALNRIRENLSWNVVDEIFGIRPHLVNTSSNLLQVVGKRHFGLKAQPVGGGGGVMLSRKLFNPLVTWIPRLELNDKGETTFDFTLNDSLSSFRIQALVSAGDDYFGTSSSLIQSTKDVLSFVGLPQVGRQGETHTLEVSLKNTTKSAKNLTVRVEADPFKSIDPRTLTEKKASVAADGSKVLFWPVKIPSDLANIKYVVSVLDGETLIDRQEVSQKILPISRPRVVEASIQRLESSKTLPFQFQEDVDLKQSLARVVLARSIASSMEGVKSFAVDYPFNCFEQQVSRGVILEDQNLWRDVVKQFGSYVAVDQLLAFYPDARKGDLYLTTYVLQMAKSQNIDLPKYALRALMAELESRVSGQSEFDAKDSAENQSQFLSAVLTLKNYGKLNIDILKSFDVDPSILTAASLIDLLMILGRDVPPELNELHKKSVAALDGRLSVTGTSVAFNYGESSRSEEHFLRPRETDLMRLLLLSVETGYREGERGQIASAVNNLKRKNGAWRTSVSNAYGALAMRRFKATEKAADLTGTTTVSFDKDTKSATWSRGDERKVFDFEPQSYKPLDLKLNHDGSGTPWYTVQTILTDKIPKAYEQGFTLQKSVTLSPSKAAKEVKVGDLVDVKLKLNVHASHGMVALQEPVPTGASILPAPLGKDSEKRLEAYAMHRESSSTQMVLYFNNLPAGEYVLHYRYRMNQAGRYLLPVTHVEAMYAPEQMADLPNESVTVVDPRIE